MVQPVKNYATFIRGIITEASPLTFPENASIDEQNFVLQRDGSRLRRLGVDYEANHVLSSSIAESVFRDQAIHTSEWRTADNNSLNNFAVVQIGDTLYFYDLSKSDLSANLKGFTVDLSLHKTAAAFNIGSQAVSTSVGKGVLFVASGEIDPFYIEYDTAADSILSTPIVLEVRDFDGVDDGLAVDTHPAVATDEHTYNLLNQGWTTDHIATYLAAQSVNPSNADVWILGKNASDVFTPSLLDKQHFGNTPAPKGHFIIDAFERERLNLATETDTGRPTALSFYQGRVFYAGTESSPSAGPSVNSKIFFSQSLISLDRAGSCHQEADPTSENISDLVDTDGGVIEIPEVGQILKLVAVRDSLVVLADNGVWQISGGGAAFTGTNFQVDKVTTVGATNSGSVIAVGSAVLYWTESGVYILEAETATTILAARSLTEDSIQTLYNDIPSVARLNVVGSYDVAAKRISWLYNDDVAYDGIVRRFKYNKELVFDAVLQSWYVHSISDLAALSPYIAGVVTTTAFVTDAVQVLVEAAGVDVEASAVEVYVEERTPIRGLLSTKYLVVAPVDANNSKLTWAEYRNTDFIEWEKADSTGVDYLSYLITGYELFGDMMRPKYVPYITCHFARTETGFVVNAGGGLDVVGPSSCLLQSRWEWADSAAGGRWGTAQQVYRLPRLYIPTGASDTFDDGFSVATTKSILRGRGKSLSLYFYSEAGKDCHILGWALAGTGARDV